MKRGLMILLVGLILISVAFAAGKTETSPGKVQTIQVYPERFTPGVDRAIATLPPLKAFEEIAAQYAELHPDIQVEFYNYMGNASNSAEYMSWITTQSIAGTLPELVMAQATELEGFKENDWFVDLMPYMYKPNPYVQGNERWIDLFGEKIISTRQSSTGELWSLPISLVATSIFYNKDLLDSLSLEAPQDWESFMHVLRTIKEETDVIPFLFDMSQTSNTSWSYRVFLSFLFEPLLPQIDLNEDEIISSEEFARAVKKGVLGAETPQHREILRLYNEWKDYFQRGFLSKPAQGLFSRGQAAMWWGGIWELLPLEVDPLRKFELGTFYVPRITSATSQYADDSVPMRMIGGASGVQLAVSRSAMDKGLVDQAVDFLMYITTPEHNGRITSESKELAPIVIGAKADASLESFLEQANNGITTFIIERFFSPEQMNDWFRAMQDFLSGKISLDEATARIQKVYMAAADLLIEKNQFSF
jgi:raffinose/stachyose/melibiose transport system substrate-binding protein